LQLFAAYQAGDSIPLLLQQQVTMSLAQEGIAHTCVDAALLLHSQARLSVMAHGVVERFSWRRQACIRVKHGAVRTSWLELNVGTATLGNSQHTSVSAHNINQHVKQKPSVHENIRVQGYA
jgi:hypothetical protein